MIIFHLLIVDSQAQESLSTGQSFYTAPLRDAGAIYFTKDNFDVFGDGKGDDAPALQAAIDLVEQTTGSGIIFVPEGNYRLGKTIYLWRGIRLIGYGRQRPTFILGEHTPGFQEGQGKYLIHFCNHRLDNSQEIQDASNTTFFSGISNINVEIRAGNPAAIAIRYHVAQHSFLQHMDFNLGSATAGVEEMGNIIEDCTFRGGEWGIKTGRTSPGWQAMVLDCRFDGQKQASIETRDAGMTVIRCGFINAPSGINIPRPYNENLFVKDSRFENMKTAINIGHYFNPASQVNLNNVTFAGVDMWLTYPPVAAGTSKTVPFPDKEFSYMAIDKVFTVENYAHGLMMEVSGNQDLLRKFNTVSRYRIDQSKPDFMEKDIPDLPAQDTWVNIAELGAKGDGVSDDTPIFREAIRKYEAIYIPMGSYLITETLFLNKKTALIGLHPSMTRFILKPETPAFSQTDLPKPLLVAPKGGANIITGIGFNPGMNKGAISLKWMAGSGSYVDDVFFFYKGGPKGEGQFYGLWITEGGGGTFKNIWAPNDFDALGLLITDTRTPGRMYEVSVEHHTDHEVVLKNVENWSFYALQNRRKRWK